MVIMPRFDGSLSITMHAVEVVLNYCMSKISSFPSAMLNFVLIDSLDFSKRSFPRSLSLMISSKNFEYSYNALGTFGLIFWR